MLHNMRDENVYWVVYITLVVVILLPRYSNVKLEKLNGLTQNIYNVRLSAFRQKLHIVYRMCLLLIALLIYFIHIVSNRKNFPFNG